MKAQHTPEKWIYKKGNGSKEKYYIQTEGGFQIASVPGVACYHEANARLIAAAPDMLAALKSIIDHKGKMDSKDWELFTGSAMRAIAQAEGN